MSSSRSVGMLSGIDGKAPPGPAAGERLCILAGLGAGADDAPFPTARDVSFDGVPSDALFDPAELAASPLLAPPLPTPPLPTPPRGRRAPARRRDRLHRLWPARSHRDP